MMLTHEFAGRQSTMIACHAATVLGVLAGLLEDCRCAPNPPTIPTDFCAVADFDCLMCGWGYAELSTEFCTQGHECRAAVTFSR